jgi:hypothetical protein
MARLFEQPPDPRSTNQIAAFNNVLEQHVHIESDWLTEMLSQVPFAAELSRQDRPIGFQHACNDRPTCVSVILGPPGLTLPCCYYHAVMEAASILHQRLFLSFLISECDTEGPRPQSSFEYRCIIDAQTCHQDMQDAWRIQLNQQR